MRHIHVNRLTAITAFALVLACVAFAAIQS